MTLVDEGGGEESTIEQALPATADIPYAWWGRSYAWSPNGQYLAYAQADQVGVVSVTDRALIPLISFPEYRTQSHWAWVPDASWSQDSYLVSFISHEGDLDGSEPEDSPIFSLWIASVDGDLSMRLAEEVGMWSQPRWSPVDDGLLVYGQAQSPRNSQDSRYDLFVMDRDGSNKRQVFPPEGFMGLIAPDVAWSPRGDALLLENEGNLYAVDLVTDIVSQVTSDGQSSHPRWSE
jgi:Tol biopolymer transport system component